MPHVFDGLVFDLFAFLRKPRALAGMPKPDEGRDGTANLSETGTDALRRTEEEEVSFWGLTAFPIL